MKRQMAGHEIEGGIGKGQLGYVRYDPLDLFGSRLSAGFG
jgi:hypothetical protein